MKRKTKIAKRILVLILTAAMLVGNVEQGAFWVSAEEEVSLPADQPPASQTVSGNETEEPEMEDNEEPYMTVSANTVSANAAFYTTAVTAQTRTVSYVYRSYDEVAGKVTTENKTGTANVLNQAYVDQAADETDGSLRINKDAESDSAVLWVVEGTVEISGRLVFGGNVTLVLADDATLKVDKTLLNCGQLTICGQQNDSGRYVGKAIYNYNNAYFSPKLEISGGSIEMKGGSSDDSTYVAIGSVWAYTQIVINGGTVDAEITGSYTAIGGTGTSRYTDADKKDSFGSVEIHGGKVTAVTNNALWNPLNSVAAIGGGADNAKGSVIITGGTVEAANRKPTGDIRVETPAIVAENIQLKNVKLQGYGDDQASADTTHLTYPYMETALSQHYISLTECNHSGIGKYYSGQKIMQGCADCGKDEALCYELTGFTLDGDGENLTAEYTYGEKQTELAAVLKDKDGNAVTENVTWTWYDKDTVIQGATENTYTTPVKLAAGEHIFRAEATVEGMTLKGDEMTVTVNKREVEIEWGQLEFFYTDPVTEYMIEPGLTNVVTGDDVRLTIDTEGYYYVNGSEYSRRLPNTKRTAVGNYWNAVSGRLAGADRSNYVLKDTSTEARLRQWSIVYFTDKEASLSGTQNEEGEFLGRVKLTAPEGTLLHINGEDVKFQYYSGEGYHEVSYYLVKEGDTQYRTKDCKADFTIAGDGSQINTGEIGRIQDGDIVYFGTYDADFSGDAYSTEDYNGKPVAWLVLDADRTNVNTTDGMFVISRNGLGLRRSGYYVAINGGNTYDWRTGLNYAGGALQAWCGDFLNGKYAQRVTSQERELLKSTAKVMGDRNVSLDANNADSYGFAKADVSNPGGAQFQYTNVSQGMQMFLPSVEEVGLADETISAWGGADFPVVTAGYFANKEDRTLKEGAYWLRNWQQSAKFNLDAHYDHSYNFAQMGTTGNYLFTGTTASELQMRPAANVLFSKIWFLSAVGGKSRSEYDGGLAAYSVPEDTDEWKITMMDSAATQFEASKESQDENEITISYTHARTGENRYLSAVVEDENGTVTFYGRLKKLAGDAEQSGTVTFELPDGVEQGNQVFVYEEQFNGDYLVDCAGAPVLVHQVMSPEVTVTENTDLVYNGTMQQLVTLDHLENGTIQYRLDADGTWGTEIPEAKNAGDYTVYYWVQGTGAYGNIGSENKPKSVSVTISPKKIGAVWRETSLIYNAKQQAPAAKPVAADLEEGDLVTLQVNGAAKSVGSYQANAVSNNKNYELKAQDETTEFTISPKPVTVTLTSAGGVYGGSNPGVSAVLAGLEGADNPVVTLTYTGTAYNGNNVSSTSTPTDAGEYKVTASLTDPNYSLTGEITAKYVLAARKISDNEITAVTAEKPFCGSGNTVELDAADITLTDTNPAVNRTLVFSYDYQLTSDYTDNDRLSTADRPAKVKITGCGNYTGEKEISFRIVYEPGINDKSATASTDTWTKDAVTITAPDGYTVCREKTGIYEDKDFTEYFTVDSESASTSGTTVSYYLRNKATKAVSERKELVVKIDRTAPAFGAREGIHVKNSFWNTLLHTITFGLYTKSADVTITASDSLSGIQYYGYYVDTVQDSANYKVLTAEELETRTFTQVADGKFRLEDQGNKVIYAYAVDQVGIRSSYICSDGIVVDNYSPHVELLVDDTKRKDTSATVNYRVDEEGTLYILLSDKKLDSDRTENLAKLKNEIGVVQIIVTAEMVGKKQTIDFSSLSANTKYYLYASAQDYAGNAADVLAVSFQTCKQIPFVETAPVLSGIYGTTLEKMMQTDRTRVVAKKGSFITLTGVWTVTDAAQAGLCPKVGDTQTYSLTFTPTGADAAGYDPVTVEVGAKVQQAQPYIAQKPVATAITYGQNLGESIIGGGTAVHGDGQGHAGNSTAVAGTYVWKEKTLQPAVADSEKTEYTVVFLPDDNINYKSAEFGIKLTVKKAKFAPGMPESTKDVSYGCSKVGKVKLPAGWEWQTADKDKELAVGNAVTATAVYNGADKDNYEILSTEITLTRTSCKHTQTEIRNRKAAGCTEKGYTGDTYCAECGILMTQGTAVNAKGHSYTSKVLKQPTASEEGTMEYICSGCGDSYTQPIPKLADTGSNKPSGQPADNNRKTTDTEPTENTVDKADTQPAENTGDKADTQPAENTGDKTGTQSAENTGDTMDSQDSSDIPVQSGKVTNDTEEPLDVQTESHTGFLWLMGFAVFALFVIVIVLVAKKRKNRTETR